MLNSGTLLIDHAQLRKKHERLEAESLECAEGEAFKKVETTETEACRKADAEAAAACEAEAAAAQAKQPSEEAPTHEQQEIADDEKAALDTRIVLSTEFGSGVSTLPNFGTLLTPHTRTSHMFSLDMEEDEDSKSIDARMEETLLVKQDGEEDPAMLTKEGKIVESEGNQDENDPADLAELRLVAISICETMTEA